MEVIDPGKPKCSARFAMQYACRGDHPSFCVGLTCDVIVSIVDVHCEVSGLILIKYTNCYTTNFIVFTAIEALHVADHSLTAYDRLALEEAADGAY